MAKQFLSILSLSFLSCHGQLLDLILPSVAQSARQLNDGLLQQPAVMYTSQAAGDILTNTVGAISNVPITAVRALGVRSGLPTLISDTNVVDMTNSIVSDFNAGLANEDARLSFSQLVFKYGYPLEKHHTVTDDGYVLELYRIPNNGSVVFLMHGLLGSSDDYIIAGPESGLAYLLAQEGYDVWLGNARGNKYSRRHIELNPSQAAFWDFSWHEIGFYDLPAMIDYVLNTSNEEKVKYIGHSQGTTSFFVMTSKRPEYNDKVALMVALSPVVFMTHAQAPVFRLMAPGGGLLQSLTKSFGIYELLPDNSMIRVFKHLMCGSGPMAEILCSNELFIFFGFGFTQLNVTNLPVLYGHMPSGSSLKQFLHFVQGILSHDFRMFDHGVEENLNRYGSETPPSYNLEKVKAPVSLVYSDADWLAHPRDVDELYNKLGNVVDIHQVPYKQFNHMDFLLAKDFKILIYKRLRELLNHF